jgi:hypothetical protein
MFLLALVDESAAYQSGQMVGHFFWSMIILLGIAKCLKIARRETTNSKCVYALASLLTAWLVSFLLGGLRNTFSLSLLVSILGWGIALIFVVSGVVLAIIGLVECKQNPIYTQGRKQAIWTIVLAGVMMLLFVGGLISGLVTKISHAKNNSVAGRGRGGEYLFNEKNFRLKGVPQDWILVDMI